MPRPPQCWDYGGVPLFFADFVVKMKIFFPGEMTLPFLYVQVRLCIFINAFNTKTQLKPTAYGTFLTLFNNLNMQCS